MSLHERAREVFLAAAERPAGERARLLDTLCGDDPELRREVESLLAYAEDETSLPTAPVPAAPRARLAAGELFADRYRVVERLGSGGMGEVYRVLDTVLGVEVALKLLHTSDPASRDRLLNEVRLAREVSHPAVCRVFDVAQAGDELFFTMELVDGEDLAALLRRIGRMSPEKVVDIARQLCGGLAAAHARGVLHRDLKPSNVLIDRQGRVRLSDFGIATTRAEASRAEAAGTPGYMAPEQVRPGTAISERTDLYSLALVLYELLVGAPAFAETGLLTSVGRTPRRPRVAPSRLAAGVPPSLERVILLSLEPDPADRPASALELARELPGVDPEVMAREAGIPLPPVAESAASRGGLRRWQRWALLALVLVGTLETADLADDEASFRPAIPRREPVLLVERAREVERVLGHEPRASGSEWGFVADPFAPGDADRVVFWYREQGQAAWPRALERLAASSSLHAGEAIVPGGTLVLLDREERLLLYRRRLLVGEETAGGWTVDWAVVMRLAGLDPAGMKEAAADPLVGAGARAWEGERPGAGTTRLDAAAPDGRAAYVAVGAAREPGSEPPASQGRTLVAAALLVPLLLALLAGGCWLAWRNLRRGQADLRLARRLGAVTFGLAVAAAWVGPPSHPLQVGVLTFYLGLLGALLLGVAVAVGSLGYQPLVRRAFPRLGGWESWRELADPAGGASLLAGAAAGALVALCAVGLVAAGPAGIGPALLGPTDGRIAAGLGLGATVSAVLAVLVGAVTEGLTKLVVLALAMRWLRRTWAAAAAFVLLEVGLRLVGAAPLPQAAALAVVQSGLGLLLLLRFGPLAFVAASFTWGLLRALPVTDDLGAWYGPAGLAALVLVLAVGLAGFLLAGRREPARPRN